MAEGLVAATTRLGGTTAKPSVAVLRKGAIFPCRSCLWCAYSETKNLRFGLPPCGSGLKCLIFYMGIFGSLFFYS